MERYDSTEIINVGCGQDISIAELAALVRDIVGYRGDIEFDRSKPDGTPLKLLDVSKTAALGWQPRTTLADGIARTYAWYVSNAQSPKPHNAA
jgi:GDP-L-fucose synthase